LVLSAVFVPCAFISGITGLFFRQFALTIAVSTIISAFNSLTLSPALTALLLRPLPNASLTRNGGHKGAGAPPLPRWAFPILGGLFGCLVAASWFEEGIKILGETFGLQASSSVMETTSWVAATLLCASLGWLLSRLLNSILSWLFRKFNSGFALATHGYTGGVGKLLR